METSRASKKSKGFWIWARQVATWMFRGFRHSCPYLILLFVFFFIAYSDYAVTKCKEQDIRWIGLLLQITGFVIVLLQLNVRLRLFRKPTFLLRMRKFIEEFPSRNRKIVNIVLEQLTVRASLSPPEIISAPSPDATVEERVGFLENEIKNAMQRLRVMEKALGNHEIENRRALDKVREKIDSGHKELMQLIDEAVVGGINMEWAGIVYFMVGICLATTSSEISYYLGYAGSCDFATQ